MAAKNFFFIFFLFLNFSFIFAEERLQTRFVKRIENGVPGQEITLQVYLTNQNSSRTVLQGALQLPPSWKATPANNILIHLMPKQTIIQTITFQISDFENEGEFVIAYEVFGKESSNFYGRDECLILVKEAPLIPPFPQKEMPFIPSEEPFESINKNEQKNKEALRLSVETDQFTLSKTGEAFFISCLIENKSDLSIKETLFLETPPDFFIVSQKEISIELAPNSSTFEIFVVQPPADLKAGKYLIFASLESTKNPRLPITIEIPSFLKFKIELQDISPCYPLNELISLNLKLLNESNKTLPVRLEMVTDPVSPCKFRKRVIQIEAKAEYLTTLELDPRLTNDDEKLFILLKVFQDETDELLCQDTFSLSFKKNGFAEDDLYSRIPAYLSTIALGDNQNQVFAVEFGGGGIIDQDKQRYLEFLFRLPTKNNNVIYGADQRLYLNIREPGTDFYIGDTVYNLTPLTQRYRYGRGIGIDVERGKLLGGAHYTENTYNNSYNPKESACYLGVNVTKRLYLQTSYLNRLVQEEKTSNIVSGSADFEIADKNNLEVEVAKDFIKKSNNHDTAAFRFNLTGQTKNHSYFQLEKIHAGPSFYGYYNDLDTLSGIIDFPVSSQLRANLSATKLRQNLKHGTNDESRSFDPSTYASSYYDYASLKQRQWQTNGNLSYNFLKGGSITLNGLLLRAKDKGDGSLYDFYQQWGGFTSYYPYRNWNLNAIVAFGNQDDYIGRKSESFLQRYWISLSRQINEKLFTNFFYEGGNTNYYDAKPWRNTYGISFAYQYSRSGFAELFLQRVQNKVDMYELNQMSFNLNHTFSNLHQLEISTQYFHYKSHYRNDFLFFISYTIPFSLPIHKRKDIGILSGYVENTGCKTPVERALVEVANQRCLTDAKGRFSFKDIKSGPQEVKIQNLPANLVTENQAHSTIAIRGGKENLLILPVTTTCSIKGNISLSVPKEFLGDSRLEEELNEKLLLEENLKGVCLASIKILINRKGGQEIYTTQTNSKGLFNFSKLRPGNWSIKILKDSISFDCEIKDEELFFSIDPNEEVNASFELKLPTIKILPMEN